MYDLLSFLREQALGQETALLEDLKEERFTKKIGNNLNQITGIPLNQANDSKTSILDMISPQERAQPETRVGLTSDILANALQGQDFEVQKKEATQNLMKNIFTSALIGALAKALTKSDALAAGIMQGGILAGLQPLQSIQEREKEFQKFKNNVITQTFLKSLDYEIEKVKKEDERNILKSFSSALKESLPSVTKEDGSVDPAKFSQVATYLMLHFGIDPNKFEPIQKAFLTGFDVASKIEREKINILKNLAEAQKTLAEARKTEYIKGDEPLVKLGETPEVVYKPDIESMLPKLSSDAQLAILLKQKPELAPIVQNLLKQRRTSYALVEHKSDKAKEQASDEKIILQALKLAQQDIRWANPTNREKLVEEYLNLLRKQIKTPSKQGPISQDKQPKNVIDAKKLHEILFGR